MRLRNWSAALVPCAAGAVSCRRSSSDTRVGSMVYVMCRKRSSHVKRKRRNDVNRNVETAQWLSRNQWHIVKIPQQSSKRVLDKGERASECRSEKVVTHKEEEIVSQYRTKKQLIENTRRPQRNAFEEWSL